MSLSQWWRRLRAATAAVLAVLLTYTPAVPVSAHLDPPGRELHVEVHVEYTTLTQDQDDGLDGDAELRMTMLINHLPDHGA